MIYIINKEKINEKFQWLKLSTFNKYLKICINDHLNNSDNNLNENLIKYIEDDVNILIEDDKNIKDNKMNIDSENCSPESFSEDDENNSISYDNIDEMIENINEINLDESAKNPEIKSFNLVGCDNVKKNINDIDIDTDNLGLKDNNLNGTNIIRNINISENIFDNNDSKNLSDNNKYLPLMERIKKKDNSLTNLIDNFENEFKKKLCVLNPLNENMIIQVVKIKKKKKKSFVKMKKKLKK